jgi:hypothetical protein
MQPSFMSLLFALLYGVLFGPTLWADYISPHLVFGDPSSDRAQPPSADALNGIASDSSWIEQTAATIGNPHLCGSTDLNWIRADTDSRQPSSLCTPLTPIKAISDPNDCGTSTTWDGDDHIGRTPSHRCGDHDSKRSWADPPTSADPTPEPSALALALVAVTGVSSWRRWKAAALPPSPRGQR